MLCLLPVLFCLYFSLLERCLVRLGPKRLYVAQVHLFQESPTRANSSCGVSSPSHMSHTNGNNNISISGHPQCNHDPGHCQSCLRSSYPVSHPFMMSNQSDSAFALTCHYTGVCGFCYPNSLRWAFNWGGSSPTKWQARGHLLCYVFANWWPGYNKIGPMNLSTLGNLSQLHPWKRNLIFQSIPLRTPLVSLHCVLSHFRWAKTLALLTPGLLLSRYLLEYILLNFQQKLQRALMKYGEVVQDLGEKGANWIYYDTNFRYLRQKAPADFPCGNIHFELWITSQQCPHKNNSMPINTSRFSCNSTYVPVGYCR